MGRVWVFGLCAGLVVYLEELSALGFDEAT